MFLFILYINHIRFLYKVLIYSNMFRVGLYSKIIDIFGGIKNGKKLWKKNNLWNNDAFDFYSVFYSNY